MSLAGVAPEILLPALAAGVLVLATHVPLGREVLRRGIIFLDLAVAQIAGLGVVAVQVLADQPDAWVVQAGAVAAALAGALFLRWTERRAAARQEALIGVSFVAAACAAVLIMSGDPHAGEHLRDLLVGQILWTTPGDLAVLAGVSGAVLAAWFALGLRRSPLAFYLLFAVTVTASVQVVGVYLVFASLIVPALAAGPRRLWVGYALGLAGYAAGLLASALLDLPSGAAVVLALVAVAGAFTAVAGRPRAVAGG